MPKIFLAFSGEEQISYQEFLIDNGIDPQFFQSAANDQTEIILGSPKLIVDLLPLVPNVKWVQSSWAGVEPLLEAKKKDYILTNARGIFGQLMAEFVLGYILFFEKNILDKIYSQQDKVWDKALPSSLKGKKIGLVGVGSIGSEIARVAKVFNMHVVGYTESSEVSTYIDEYYHGSDLPKMMAGLDFLVCVLPNTFQTRGLIDLQLMQNLPEKCVLFNVGRGQVLDEIGLATLLNAGKLRAAVLDVFKQEPLPQSDPLWTAKNLYITSHTSAPSFLEDVALLFLKNYQRYLSQKPLEFQVNFEKGY